MNEIGEFFANNYIIFIIIAIFSVFALVGYIVENKNDGRRQSMPNINPQNTMSADLEKLKSNLANKSLNSMVSNTMSPTNNTNNNGSNNNFNGIDKL